MKCFLFIALSAALALAQEQRIDSIQQKSSGPCTQNAAGVQGNNNRITLNCVGIDPHAMDAFNEQLRKQNAQIKNISDMISLAVEWREKVLTSGYTVPQLATVYDFPTEFNGTGQRIGFIEFGGGYRDSDLNAYFSSLHVLKPAVSWVPVDGTSNAPGKADERVTADLEIAGAAAPGAQFIVYFAPATLKGWVDALNAVVNDSKHKPSVLVVGKGGPEGYGIWTKQATATVSDILHSLVINKTTVLAATGDGGAADGSWDGKLRVDFPASSPWVLAVGGTTLIASGYRIQSETVWNELSLWGRATGGGTSGVFARPKWQTGVKVSNQPEDFSGRAIPDVAANADPVAGYRVRIDGRGIVVGGTGAAAALWAGLIAIVNQTLGRDVGYINPLLYGTIGPAGILRHITEGDNGRYSAAVPPSPSNPPNSLLISPSLASLYFSLLKKEELRNRLVDEKDPSNPQVKELDVYIENTRRNIEYEFSHLNGSEQDARGDLIRQLQSLLAEQEDERVTLLGDKAPSDRSVKVVDRNINMTRQALNQFNILPRITPAERSLSWNACTGWGAPRGKQFLDALRDHSQ